MPDELTQIRIAMHDLRNDLQNVSDRLHETNDALDKLTKKMDVFMEKAEERFAGKWTEKLLIFVGSAVGIALIGAFMALLLTNGR
jgi:hypothetical protein